MAAEAEDAFQRELIELFVQEAQEWLQQIHVALDELQQGPAADRHLKLAQTIRAGLTNLGGSAATINLSDVERASFSALPFVEAIQDPALPISVGDFIVLCKQLGHIHTALTSATGVAFNAESAGARPQPIPHLIPTKDFLSALNELQQRQTGKPDLSRNLVPLVSAQIQGLVQDGVAHCDVAAMRTFLDRSGEAEDAFYALVQQQLPVAADDIARLKNEGESSGRRLERLEAVLDRVTQLWTAAQQVNASQAMTFFMGLHSFLSVVAQQRVSVAAQKYGIVEARLRTMFDAIRVWVETGRSERSAIADLLPHEG